MPPKRLDDLAYEVLELITTSLDGRSPLSFNGQLVKKTSPQGTLLVLELVGNNKSGRVPIDKASLKIWDVATDFTCLDRLNLGSIDEGALQWAIDEKKPFRNLKSLKILILSKSQALHDKLGAFLEFCRHHATFSGHWTCLQGRHGCTDQATARVCFLASPLCGAPDEEDG